MRTVEDNGFFTSPAGWTIKRDGSPDYDAPDGWAIWFVEVSEGTGEKSVWMASLEGFEPPTRRLEGGRSLL